MAQFVHSFHDIHRGLHAHYRWKRPADPVMLSIGGLSTFAEILRDTNQVSARNLVCENPIFSASVLRKSRQK